jgi:hypothetical protein
LFFGQTKAEIKKSCSLKILAKDCLLAIDAVGVIDLLIMRRLIAGLTGTEPPMRTTPTRLPCFGVVGSHRQFAADRGNDADFRFTGYCGRDMEKRQIREKPG